VFSALHRCPGWTPSRPPAAAEVGDAKRHACVDALVAMLVAGVLSEDEFDLRWHAALVATTTAELDDLRYRPEPEDEATRLGWVSD
jgi:hypothetical protein